MEAVAGAVVKWVFTRWMSYIWNRIRRWRKEKKWKEMLGGAEILCWKVRAVELEQMYVSGFTDLILNRTLILWNFSGRPKDMCAKDRDIIKWNGEVRKHEEVILSIKEGLSSDDFLRYDLEYKTGKFLVDWEEEMSAEFRESHKTRIENLRQRIASPVQMTGAGDMNPANIDPTFPPHIVLEHEDGSTEHLMNDGCSLPDWVAQLGNQ